MTGTEFAYRTILKSDESGTITSMVAHHIDVARPLQAVLWSVPRKAWIYAPGLAVRFIYDDQLQDRVQVIDRPTAEEIARDVLRADLPTEASLMRLCEEGERMGWTYGPPRA
nr:hypothetical protein GCM10020092_002830 [Actinoplanes digitatis]